MKRLINGLKRIFLMVGAFLGVIYTKVIAVELDAVQILYGPPLEQDLYGVPRTNETVRTGIWNLLKGLVIPIVFIVGTIIYFKKSTSSVSKKIITILIALAIIVLICFGINYLIKLI